MVGRGGQGDLVERCMALYVQDAGDWTHLYRASAAESGSAVEGAVCTGCWGLDPSLQGQLQPSPRSAVEGAVYTRC
jgi:hypothetical protein